MTPFDVLVHTGHRASGILEQALLLIGAHQTEQISRLLEWIIAQHVVVVIGIAIDGQWRLGERRLLLPMLVAVWLNAWRATAISVYAHCAITVE